MLMYDLYTARRYFIRLDLERKYSLIKLKILGVRACLFPPDFVVERLLSPHLALLKSSKANNLRRVS